MDALFPEGFPFHQFNFDNLFIVENGVKSNYKQQLNKQINHKTNNLNQI